MNTNFAQSIEAIRTNSFNRKYTNDVTNDRYHERSSHGNSSTDDKDDDSNSCPSGHNSVDGFNRYFPFDDDRTPASGDSSYRKRRMKNNEAARKSREKRRRLDAELRRELELVIAENRSLRHQLKLLRVACGLPIADENIIPATGVTTSISTKSERIPVKKESSCRSATSPPASMTSPDVKLEPEGCDSVVSAASGFEPATRGNCDRFPTGVESASVHLDPASTDGIDRLLLAANCGLDHSIHSTPYRLGVDWRASPTISATVGDGAVEALQYENTEPLNLSTDTTGTYETGPTRMVCV